MSSSQDASRVWRACIAPAAPRARIATNASPRPSPWTPPPRTRSSAPCPSSPSPAGPTAGAWRAAALAGACYRVSWHRGVDGSMQLSAAPTTTTTTTSHVHSLTCVGWLVRAACPRDAGWCWRGGCNFRVWLRASRSSPSHATAYTVSRSATQRARATTLPPRTRSAKPRDWGIRRRLVNCRGCAAPAALRPGFFSGWIRGERDDVVLCFF